MVFDVDPKMRRRRALRKLGELAFGAGVAVLLRSGVVRANPDARDGQTLEVAYAGSMASLMEGPVKEAVTRKLGFGWHGRAQGSNALARLIAGDSIHADVFIAITPSPMRIVLSAGKAALAVPIARTEMVIAYSNASRFATSFAASAQPGAALWWQILQQPGMRFGRTDPLTDPQGRNIIFALELAAKYYRQPQLAARILGGSINPRQIFPEPTLLARLQAGELDAASAYKVQPSFFNLPYLSLPREINLTSDRLQPEYDKVSLDLNGTTYRPEPLVYYAAILKKAANLSGAHQFVDWLRGSEAQTILRHAHYDVPGSATPLQT